MEQVSANHCTGGLRDLRGLRLRSGKGGKGEEDKYVRGGRKLDRKGGEVETFMSTGYCTCTGEVKKT